MANGHGGYRQPAHPAPHGSSGPGKFSKRTDTGPKQSISTVPGQDYGDAKQQAMDQRTAPMEGTQPLPPAAPVGAPAGDQQSFQMPQGGADFSMPSQRPGEPVTHGVDIGPGAGSEALTLPGPTGGQQANGAMSQMLQSLSATDTTGVLAQLYQAARTQGV